ncbi:MAG: hypothetical protein HYU97_02970 [Deltaproteobacteria bacterium]|nr:hypothetical protein [Deltaproteobacteria bacterium]
MNLRPPAPKASQIDPAFNSQAVNIQMDLSIILLFRQINFDLFWSGF